MQQVNLINAYALNQQLKALQAMESEANKSQQPVVTINHCSNAGMRPDTILDAIHREQKYVYRQLKSLGLTEIEYTEQADG